MSLILLSSLLLQLEILQTEVENLNDKLCTTEAEMNQKSQELSSLLEVSTYIMICRKNIMCPVGVKQFWRTFFCVYMYMNHRMNNVSILSDHFFIH